MNLSFLFYVLELPVPDEFIIGNLTQSGYGSLAGIGVRKSVQLFYFKI